MSDFKLTPAREKELEKIAKIYQINPLKINMVMIGNQLK